MAHLLQTGDYPDVELKSFASHCAAKPFDEEGLLKLLGDQVDQYNKIIVIVSTCFRKAKNSLQNFENIEVVKLEQCFEILFSLPSVYHFIKQGNYLVTNGWLRNYKQHVREWGFNPKTAKNYFGESVKRVLMLQTGLPGDYQANLEALAEYMGLPYEVFPIGSSHLQKTLDALVLNWRNEKERLSLNDSIMKFSRETSEHLLIFNHLKELVNVSDPIAIIDKIGFMCDMLFAPDQLIFEGFNEGKTYESRTLKGGKAARNRNHSFLINFEFNREVLGVLDVVNVIFPEFMPQYQSMASVIGQMGGLALSNAIRFTDLEEAKQKIQESGAHFKSLMKQSPSVIEIYDLEGYQRSVNKAYEELWGFPATHTVGKFNLFKSDEVKSTGLIDYIERAYNGESVTVPVYKFDPTGKNEAHGIGRIRWLSTRMYPLKNQSDKVQSLVVTHEDVTEQKIAEEKLAERNEKFKLLSRSATEMLHLETLDEIYTYITNWLHGQYPKAVLLFNQVNLERNITILTHISGVPQNLIDKVESISRVKMLGKEFDLFDFHKTLFSSGKFEKVVEGFWAFSSSKFSKTTAKIIEKLVGIKEIYTIGIKKDDKLFAAIHFFNRSDTPISDNEFIESFLTQAGIIIDRKLGELEVLKSEERFRSIFEESPIGIALINSINGKIIELNDKFASIAGRTPDEMRNIDWMQLNHPDDVQKDLVNMAKINAGLIKGFNMQKRYIRTDGDIVWVNVTIAPVGFTPDGQPIHLRMVEDISRNKETELKLQQLSHAVTQSPVSIVITDLDGKVEFANPVVLEVTGYTYNELLGQNPNVFKSGHTTSEEYGILWKTIKAGNVWRGEFLNKKKNGELYWEDAVISPIKNDQGDIVNFMAIKQDITKLKEATSEIINKNEALKELVATKDKFFSIISHDLRSPLSSILNLSELFTDDSYSFSAEELKTFGQSINQTADSTYRLLENLLEWSRLQRGAIPFKPELIDIAGFLNSCDHSIIEKAKNKRIKIDMQFTGGLSVFADENMLRSIMRNLISNAIKFTKPDGRIIIEISKSEQNETLFAISDNGIGIPIQILENLFSITEKTSRPGTDNEPSSGLGLILCKEFVEKHGGKIWAESNIDEKLGSTGSKFYFTIPN
jgi:PAS domain S-box-containing protein